MKLYTEDQVRMLDINCGNATLDEVIECLTPIELPTDDEIEAVGTIVYGGEDAVIHDILQYKAFKRGAKYVINKIKGGNNEQQ